MVSLPGGVEEARDGFEAAAEKEERRRSKRESAGRIDLYIPPRGPASAPIEEPPPRPARAIQRPGEELPPPPPCRSQEREKEREEERDQERDGEGAEERRRSKRESAGQIDLYRPPRGPASAPLEEEPEAQQRDGGRVVKCDECGVLRPPQRGGKPRQWTCDTCYFGPEEGEEEEPRRSRRDSRR